jgi:hypothetical protein
MDILMDEITYNYILVRGGVLSIRTTAVNCG